MTQGGSAARSSLPSSKFRPTWSGTAATRSRCTRWPTTGSIRRVATGRLLQQRPGSPGSAAWRCTGCCADRASAAGPASLVTSAIVRGDHEAMLHAQCSAQDFYLGLASSRMANRSMKRVSAHRDGPAAGAPLAWPKANEPPGEGSSVPASTEPRASPRRWLLRRNRPHRPHTLPSRRGCRQRRGHHLRADDVSRAGTRVPHELMLQDT